MKHKYIISIDPGISHFGFVHVKVIEHSTGQWSFDHLEHYEVIDIKKELCGTSFLSDSLNALFEHYEYEFEHCECIIVEWQPPTGVASFNELFHLSKYCAKIKFMHPQRVHSILGFKFKENDLKKRALLRKNASESFFFKQTGVRLYQERKHDIADAFAQFWVCMLLHNSQFY